jgi:ketosteroid isomerase-like protein
MSRRTDLVTVTCSRLLLLPVLLCAPALAAQTAAPPPGSVASGPVPPAPPPGPQQIHGRHVRDQIENLEQQWRSATVTGDAVTIDKLLSEDYVGISWTGQVNTKAMQLDRIRNRTTIVHSMELNDVKVKIAQSVAIVTCRATVDSVNDGKDTSGEFRYTRVYLRQPSGLWKITNFEATRIGPPGRPGGPGHHKGPPPPTTPGS